MTLSSHAHRRTGFTLIELLTVVAIISLLIGILLPSLSRARDQAKKATVAGMISAIDKGLDMFYNDFRHYPDSSLRQDPIITWDIYGVAAGDQPPDGAMLSGAHWLARALVGHDFDGVDAGEAMMGDGNVQTLTYHSLLNNDPDTGKKGIHSDRKGVYMEGEIFARDNDLQKFRGLAPDTGYTGRMVVVDDAFGSPVLYYRANPRAQQSFSEAGTGGTYCFEDNQRITGKAVIPAGGGPSGEPSLQGWDFASAGKLPSQLYHVLGTYVDSTDHDDVDNNPNSFNGILHSESACKAARKIKPYNAERFILISAGKDGRFGTSDDVTNFKSGL